MLNVCKKKRFVRTMSGLYKRIKQCDFEHSIVTAFSVHIRYFRCVSGAYSYVEVFLSSRLEFFFGYPRVCGKNVLKFFSTITTHTWSAIITIRDGESRLKPVSRVWTVCVVKKNTHIDHPNGRDINFVFWCTFL